MNDMQTTAQAKPSDEQKREARRLLLKGGLAGAPVVLTTMSTPVMATTQSVLGSCQSASQFASTPHASKATATQQFTAYKAFELDVILRAIAKLFQPGLNVGSLSGTALSALIALSGRVGGLITYKFSTGISATVYAAINCTLSALDQSDNCKQLSLYKELLLLTYLNLSVPTASSSLTVCLGLSEQDLVNLAGEDGSITRGGRVLRQAEVEPWLRNVFGLAAGAAIDLKVLGKTIL